MSKFRGTGSKFSACNRALYPCIIGVVLNPKQCRAAIDPNLTEAQIEEMLIQHLLTERIFRTVFDNPDFTNRNIIAQEIEKVIRVLTQRSPSRSEFLRPLNPFYIAIEKTAATITDFSQKQSFLNTVYEQFFQGFSVNGLPALKS